jgi:hypothetical protein
MLNPGVTELERLLAELKRKGVTIIGEPPGGRVWKIRGIMDPEANKIELWQPPETKKTSRCTGCRALKSLMGNLPIQLQALRGRR